MRTHVTLVNPPYPPPSSFQHPPFPALALGYLAAVLEKNQYEVDLIDCLTPRRLTYEEFRNEVSKRQPDIVGITSTIITYKSALQIAKIAKKVCPKCLTVIGGPHVTFQDKKALQECASLDIVVRKEGENTLLELAERIEAGKDYYDVLGITCRKDGKIVKNPDRAYIENLDDIPFPARHLWPIECLQKFGTTAIFDIYTSRGCVYWCDFCTEVRMHGRKYRTRSPKNVVDELEFLHKKYGAEYFVFCDAAFTIDQPRVEEICEEIRNRKLKIKWACGTRVDMVTKEMLLKMREAGCIAVWFGVESGSQHLLDSMKKEISLAQTIRAFKWTKEAGLRPEPNVILGFPGETKETAWETIKFVEKISPDFMGFYTIATPYPGTPMYDLVKKNGWLKVTDFDKYDTATPIFETPMLSMKELRKIHGQTLQSFYLRPTYVLRMFAKGGTYGFSAARKAFAYLLIAIRSKLQHARAPMHAPGHQRLTSLEH
jgi:anaerobic magnesium-protoporphyrin IX monomethyl ester cyclase